MLLDARLRRLTTYLYVQDLLPGAAVLDVGAAGGAAEGAEGHDVLRARGAQSVHPVAASGLGEVTPGSFDVAFALDLEPAAVRATAEALKRALKPTGTAVLAVASRDRPGARSGMSYYELLDLLGPLFPTLKMVGQAPFLGSTLVEYGVAEPDPVLDGTLVPKGERVEWYVAVAGPDKGLSRGYGVMQVPAADVGGLPAERRVAPPVEAKKAAPPVPVAPAPKAPEVKVVSDEELKSQLQAAQKGRSELMEFVQQLRGQLAERDAYVAELDGERRELSRLRENVRLADGRTARAEASERETRKKLAEAEGTVMRLRGGGTVVTAPVATTTVALEAPATAEGSSLAAELEKWKSREADARAEAWKAHKQRADAEAQAAEVREDTVRKLKDARKLASVELTRATEEAMKKAVTLKEELTRAERERKELIAEVKRLTAELETARAAPPPAPPMPVVEAAPTHDELHGRVATLERDLVNADAIAAADRARTAQLLADMEREAQERSDVAVRLRHALREREREVAALRHELAERDARLTAFEQQTPPTDEVERLEAELATARGRLGTVMQELARKEAQVERAAAAASHERTRAERMMAGERHALDVLTQARTRATEAERQLEVARERLGRLELELRGEAERVGALEQAMRRAAESARNGHGGTT